VLRCQPGEDRIGLHGVGQVDTGEILDAAGQSLGHLVGVRGTASPQVVVQQGQELSGQETHL
jgi:hypothetical protein